MKIFVHQNDFLILEATVLNEDLLNGGEVFIGRDDDCHIKLDSHKVSRHHASLFFSDNSLKVRSLSQFKKVKVAGNEIEEQSISNGTQIIVDNYIISIDKFEVSSVQENEDNISPEETPVSSEVIQEEQDSIGDLSDSEDENLDESADEEGTDIVDTLADEELDSTDDDNTQIDNDVEGFGETEDEELSDDSDFGSEEEDFGGDDFSGDDEGFESDDDSSTQVFQAFASYKIKIFGEYAPFDTFSVTEPITQIGRDTETCQIALSDPEVSKVHAIIRKSLINLTLEDNNSSNGIILNGERINKSELTNGDEFIIGETTFTVEISSDLLDSERDRLMPIEENQEIIIEGDDDLGGGFDSDEEDSLDFNSSATEAVPEEKSFIKKIMKDPKKRIYAIVGILLLGLFLLDDSEESSAPKEDKSKRKKVEKVSSNKKFSKEIQDQINQNYALALAKFNNNQFYQAKEFINKVKKYDPNYKLTASLDKSIQESLDAITRAKEEEEKKKERVIRQKRVQELVVKAREAVKERKVDAARAYFSSIYELDPENIDIPPLKIEIDSYEDEQARIKQEAALKKEERNRMIDQLKPGKQLYLKEDWYKAIAKLENFLKIKDMDEDLIKEGTEMLITSKRNLLRSVDPLLSKARSFKEGQDLKLAFETYGEALSFDPSNEEALNERAAIFAELEKRSKKLYREALIKEDLSDFTNAKEKFQEVQQISPINSEYFIKASDKLKNYLE